MNNSETDSSWFSILRLISTFNSNLQTTMMHRQTIFKLITTAALALPLFALPIAVSAQSKIITIVVPYPAGGPLDISARS